MRGLLKITGKVTIAIDRTQWKFGETWINILTLSVIYRQIAIPIMWHTINEKGNASAAQHIEISRRFITEFGTERIEKVLADREFGSRQLFEFLLSAEIDFLIRLKSNHLADGISFKKRWGDVAERVKLRGKVKTKVFGLEIYISCVKLKKAGKLEYLIVASGKRNNRALEEYKLRWRIETMFGCLKSRGFDFEETHLSEARKISKLLQLLGVALCLAVLMGEIQVEKLKRVKMKLQNTGRYAKSLLKIGLEALQNILFNRKIPDKSKCFNLLLILLSCT
jgi:hypothetical protein